MVHTLVSCEHLASTPRYGKGNQALGTYSQLYSHVTRNIGLAFHLIWLAIVHRVSALLWTEEESFRIAQVGKLSALYSSIGPAIGVLLAGFLLSGNVTDVGSSNSSMTTAMLREGFTLAYRCAIALTAASFVASWGWSTTS